MPNVAGFGFGFDEVMQLATVVTFILILAIPVKTATENVRPVNVLDYPGATLTAFNYLWFNDFKIPTSCLGSTIKIANYTFVNTWSSQNIAGPGVSTDVNGTTTIGGLTANTGNTTLDTIINVFSSLGNGVVLFLSYTLAVLQIALDLLFGCGFGIIRVVIGVTIILYWFFKLWPVLTWIFDLFV